MVKTFHGGHYQPLSWVTLGLDYVLWGMDPFGYHLTNLLIRAADAGDGRGGRAAREVRPPPTLGRASSFDRCPRTSSARHMSTMCSELLSGRPRAESGVDDDRYVRLLAVDPVLRSIARVDGLGPDRLRSLGLSRANAAAIVGLARTHLDGTLDLDGLDDLDDALRGGPDHSTSSAVVALLGRDARDRGRPPVPGGGRGGRPLPAAHRVGGHRPHGRARRGGDDGLGGGSVGRPGLRGSRTRRTCRSQG